MTTDDARTLTLLDLFSGAGGATRVFVPRRRWPQTPPFTPIAAVDVDGPATTTYSLNFPRAIVFRTDLAHLGYEEIRLLMRRLDLRTGVLDVLVACPPCQ